jgi:hypothetical protein
MKAISVLLSFSILLIGCFTESSITKDELAPDDSKVIFYLRDGSYIKSYSDYHCRVEGGYQVSGTIVKEGKSPEKSDRIVLDNEIDTLGVDECSVVGTLVGMWLTYGAIVLIGFHVAFRN